MSRVESLESDMKDKLLKMTMVGSRYNAITGYRTPGYTEVIYVQGGRQLFTIYDESESPASICNHLSEDGISCEEFNATWLGVK